MRYVYERRLEDKRVLVICSFSDKTQKYRLPKCCDAQDAKLLLCNYPEVGEAGSLRPYEVRVMGIRD